MKSLLALQERERGENVWRKSNDWYAWM